MDTKASSQEVITLTTVYDCRKIKTSHILVISYKLDPEGEEFFVSARTLEEYSLKKNSVNRVLIVSGGGTHLPIINSRIMLDCVSLKASFTPKVNENPRPDYYVFYRRENKIWVTVGEVLRINFGLPEKITSAELAEIFKGIDVVKFSGASKTGSTVNTKTQEKKCVSATDTQGKSEIATGSATRTGRKECNDTTIVTTRKESAEIANVLTFSTPLYSVKCSIAQIDESYKKKLFLERCISLCIQHNIAYPPKAFGFLVQSSSRLVQVEKYFDDCFKRLLSSCLIFPKDPSHAILINMTIIIVSDGGKIIGTIHSKDRRIRGLEIIKGEVGLLMINYNLYGESPYVL